MTSDRAAEIIKQASQWPYWGNYSKFMTPGEESFVRQKWGENPNDNSSFASTLFQIKNDGHAQ